jgi:hypothetical protein
MLSKILTQSILLKQHREAGFTLSEDEDRTYLMLGDRILDCWYSTSSHTTVEAIRETADTWLNRIKSGTEFAMEVGR